MPTRATKRGAQRTPLASATATCSSAAPASPGWRVARELGGSGARVLVIDRYEIGERQTSACAMPTVWLERSDLMGSLRQTFDELVVHTPVRTARWPLPWSFSTFDYRELCALLWEQAGAGELEFETATVDRLATGAHRAHRPRRAARAADRRRARLAARAVERDADPAAERAPVARPRGPPARQRRGDGAVDRPALRARRLRLELPRRATSCASASARSEPRDHVKEPTVALARELGAAGRALPGQLDPPPAARRRRGRRLLRRRLGRALPAADRRGHPHGALLRPRAADASCARCSPGARTREQALARYGAFSDSHARKYRWLLGAQRAVGRITPSRARHRDRRARSRAAAWRAGSSATTSRSRRRRSSTRRPARALRADRAAP